LRLRGPVRWPHCNALINHVAEHVVKEGGPMPQMKGGYAEGDRVISLIDYSCSGIQPVPGYMYPGTGAHSGQHVNRGDVWAR
jgi:hypothetical protein